MRGSPAHRALISAKDRAVSSTSSQLRTGDFEVIIWEMNFCLFSTVCQRYSANEVTKLLDSIDLGNPCGIRDYAIILLITRLGLRSSDVANLRFSNIDWEREVIHLNQVKTGNPLELPLLKDVGEAIINYLKNARPKTDSDHVFVRQVPPYTDFNPGAVGALVRVRLQRSGIHLEGKKKGSHTLRHYGE